MLTAEATGSNEAPAKAKTHKHAVYDPAPVPPWYQLPAWIVEADIPWAHRGIYAVIADQVRQKRICTLTVADLAARAHVAKSTAEEATRELLKLKFIVTTDEPVPRCERRMYWLPPEPCTENRDSSLSRKSGQGEGDPAPACTENRDATDPETGTASSRKSGHLHTEIENKSKNSCDEHSPSTPAGTQHELLPGRDEKPPAKRQRWSEEIAEAIYAAYPRKVGKDAAIKAIQRALGKIAQTQADPVVWLQTRVQLFATSLAGQRGMFTPHASTWFNQARYLDDDAEWQIADASGGNGRTDRSPLPTTKVTHAICGKDPNNAVRIIVPQQARTAGA